jgi:transcriptional regulator with XRE-family HTH domain
MNVKSTHPLRAICKRDNLTIEKLAEATGLGTTTVWRAFNGKPINAHSRQQLCDYFGMTSEELGLVSEKTDEVANQAPPFSNSFFKAETLVVDNKHFHHPTASQTNPIVQYLTAFSSNEKQNYAPSNGVTTLKTIVETIGGSQELQDLAQRPVLLIMMLDLFTDSQGMGENEWNIAKLYQKYTEKWLKSDTAEFASTLKWEEKAALIQEIAWSIYVTRTSDDSPNTPYERVTITQRDLSNLLERFTHRYPRTSLGQLIDDICLHTFPIVKDGDSYRFFEKSFQDYYVAQYIFELMRSKEHLVAPVALALQEFLSVEVVTFLKDMFSAKDFSRHDRALVVDILIKVYQQNIADDHHTATIRQNACSYLTFLGTQKAVQFLERVSEQEPNKWVQRGIMVGLVLFCDREDILEQYLDILHNDPEAASINIGYHLAYYGDQAPEEGYYDRGGNRCDGTVRAIFRHLRSERYRSGWAIDLFTLRMLLEQRGTVVLSANQQHLPFLGEFLNKDHRGQGRAFQQEKQLLQDILKGAALL